MATEVERCSICGCRVHHEGGYAQPNPHGRAHATRHHYVAERFFGRNANQPRQQRKPIFPSCPWEAEGKTAVFCYDCHEELLHNPVLLPEDIVTLARLVTARHINEDIKTGDRTALGERIKLLHEIIALGLQTLDPHKIRRKGKKVKTTDVGFTNRNDQQVVNGTTASGTDRDQYVYVLKCLRCGYQYGANGSDIFERKCPKCQKGAPDLETHNNC